MSERELPARPNLEQYKNQARDLVQDCSLAHSASLTRIAKHHPRFHKLSEQDLHAAKVTRTDAQLVIAREHGFESWPKFSRHIETLRLIESVASLTDPISAFIEVACIPRHSWHGSGDLEHAEMILARYPEVATANIHTAAILADEATVRRFLSTDPTNATSKGGPHNWDPLTHLCFSRYLRLDPTRAQAFLNTARALLDAGASAATGWYETIDQPTPRRTFESAIYGAAGIAQNAELTRLLLDRGADPNDEETPYHVPETYDNAVLKVLLESGKLTPESLTTILIRKADWHDDAGLQLALDHGADPNFVTRWGVSAMLHAVRRDNSLEMIESLLNHGANPNLLNPHAQSATRTAARRGRGDALRLFQQRGFAPDLHGLDALLAVCALADRETIQRLVTENPQLSPQLLSQSGTLLAEFAGNNNADGLTCILDLGVSVSALYAEGDGYFEIPRDSTALHVAAWRAQHAAVKVLLTRGAPVNALDSRGRTPLALAIKACTDSHWKSRRSPESVAALLQAGASTTNLDLPTGYEEIDTLLLQP